MATQNKSQPTVQRHIGYWGPVVVYMLGIFYLSSQSTPGVAIPEFFFLISDKVLHALAFGLLGILMYRAFSQSFSQRKSMLFSFLGTTLYGVTDELHQSFVPNRHADPADLLADAIGALVFLTIWAYWNESWLHRKKTCTTE